MDRKKIYNPNSNEHVNERKIIGGNPTGIFELNDIKYQWAYNLWDVMLNNTWFPKEVDLTQDVRDYKQLTEAEKNAYDKALSQLIFMDSLQTNNLIDNINPFITAPEINLVLVRQAFEECHVGDTKVLKLSKRTGKARWVYISTLKKGDTILAYDPDTDSQVWQKVTKTYEYDYKGKLHHFKSSRFEQKVTDKHRMPYIDRNGSFQVKRAEEFKEGIQGVGFLANVRRELEIGRSSLSPQERFLIALQADGTIFRETKDGKYKNRNGKKGYIVCSFSLTKERKRNRLEKILKDCGYSFKVSISKYGDANINDKHIYRVKVPVSDNVTKNFKDWVRYDNDMYYYVDFIDELIKWDGWDYRHKNENHNGFGYDTTDRANAIAVHKIGVLAGYRVAKNIHKDNRVEKGYKDLYRLSFVKGQVSRSVVMKEELDNKEGCKVYSLTIPTTFYYIKYNNKVSITGNSLHAQSYAVMVDSISPNTEEIYDMWRVDSKLKSKNDRIAEVYESLAQNPDEEGMLKAMFANQVLEGIYFYSGFTFFYTLARSGKMLGSAQMIRFIQRDEVTHLILFQNMINAMRKENPYLFTKELEDYVYKLFERAVDLEVSWGKYITGEHVLGLTEDIIEQYIKYLADKRLQAVKMDKLYNVDNPIKWVDDFANFNDQKTNFFEGNVTNYSKGSLDMSDF